MQLLDLPPELLGLIIDEIYPEDLPSFTSTCRTIHNQAERRLATHVELMQRLSDVRNYGHHNNDEGYTVIDSFTLLQMVQRDPFAGHYPRNITFYPLTEENYKSYSSVPLLEKASRIDFDWFLSRCEWLTAEERTEWGEALSSADQTTAALLVLGFLPNLTYVMIDGYLEKYWEYLDRLSRWVISQIHCERRHDNLPLVNVKRFVIRSLDPIVGGSFNELLGNIMDLPSLKVLTVVDLTHFFPSNWTLLNKGPQRSLIERLDLVNLRIEPDDLFQFLQRFNRLSELQLDFTMTPVFVGVEFVPDWLREFEKLTQEWMRTNGLVTAFERKNSALHIRPAT